MPTNLYMEQEQEQNYGNEWTPAKNNNELVENEKFSFNYFILINFIPEKWIY